MKDDVNNSSVMMFNMMKRSLWIGLILVDTLCSCSKKDGEHLDNLGEQTQHFTTEKADFLGPVVTKVIGPEGGSLAIAGDAVKIEVPVGSVKQPTVFSIQAVKSQIQQTAGKVNYELLPHDVIFEKPVEITFNYDPMMYTYTEDVLQVAFRDHEGKWHSLPTALDKVNHTLTVSKTSFSEFEFYEKYTLHAVKPALAASESTALKVGFIYEDYDGLLAPLVPHFTDGDACYFVLDEGMVSNILGWTIIEGPGTITPKNSFKSVATYTAPDNIVDTAATVQVRVEGVKPIKDPRLPGGQRLGGVLLLRQNVSLQSGWIKLSMNGETHLLTSNLQAGKVGSFSFGVSGQNEDGSLDLSVTVVVKGGTAGPGSYPYGLLESGTAGVSLFASNNEMWDSGYFDCGSMTGKASDGSVQITSWSDVPGEMVKGSFSTTLYRMVNECDKQSLPVTVAFQIPRSAA